MNAAVAWLALAGVGALAVGFLRLARRVADLEGQERERPASPDPVQTREERERAIRKRFGYPT